MKRIQRLIGRLLCRLGRHAWQPFGCVSTRCRGMISIAPLVQCQRCGVGMHPHAFLGPQYVPAEAMQEATTRAEIDQIAAEVEAE